MKRTLSISASDGNCSVQVVIKIKSRGLCRMEVDAQAVSAIRAITPTLADIKYADFGADNTVVKK